MLAARANAGQRRRIKRVPLLYMYMSFMRQINAPCEIYVFSIGKTAIYTALVSSPVPRACFSIVLKTGHYVQKPKITRVDTS